MTSENKKRLREEVKRGGWIIIWAGADMPCAYLDEPVELIYEDMDGYPTVCNAVYTYGDGGRRMNALPFFKRIPDGAHMMNCIAWRYRTEGGHMTNLINGRTPEEINCGAKMDGGTN